MNDIFAFLYRPRIAPRDGLSLLFFVALTALAAWLRLNAYGDRIITLSYGLPLLFCLWYPDRRLLWGLVGVSCLLATWKTFFQTPVIGVDVDISMWVIQLFNTFAIATVVHLVLDFLARLGAQKTLLEKINDKLVAREQEITRQNEELQTQAEELAQQNEEIQQQSEKVQHQSGELQVQSDELHALNIELGKRQALLETLLGAIQVTKQDQDLPDRICQALLTLFEGSASATAVLEKSSGKLLLQAHAGAVRPQRLSWEFAHSFASVVMTHDRTAFVADLQTRPDLIVPQPAIGAWRSVLSAPLRVNGSPIGSLEVYSDQPREWTTQEFKILEWVAAQCALIIEVRGLHTELRRANTDLDRAVRERTAELQEMVNELEYFSYTITHDLRSPLRAMHGFAEILTEELEPLLNEQSRLYLGRMTTSATRMDRLITDALSFSKVMRHEMDTTPQDPAALLIGMIESYPMFQPPRAFVRLEGAFPPILANEAGLTQCFSNLLGNAVKFVEKGRLPELTVRAEPRDGFVRIWFEDNGIGIAPDMQARVFVMFQRLTKEYEGTGIGLALVKKVAERMGGRVGVDSEPGRGSRFWVEFKSA